MEYIIRNFAALAGWIENGGGKLAGVLMKNEENRELRADRLLAISWFLVILASGISLMVVMLAPSGLFNR